MIQFRGRVMWNGQHYFSGDVVEGYYFKDHNGKPYIRVNEYNDGIFCRTVDLEIKPGSAERYIMKDLNDNKVFENDIVRFEDIEYGETGSSVHCSCIYEIKYQEGTYVLTDIYTGDEMFLVDMQNDNILDGIVIGSGDEFKNELLGISID